ncbi:hypothetical protein WJX81_002501 [Elliptochloris bilobata]|uniref:CDP-diacylglycerol--inositol 3-phosphatidyltransferase n=1 Tax=Elliptochloris bilobata TaxID=381761 RepID=A0AAW1RMD9_9CHLO
MVRRRTTLSQVVHNPSKKQVLLFVPNLVGYARLALVGAAACIGAETQSAALCSYWLFLGNFVLDGLDGVLARRLCQVSAFGAFLDVAVDCFSRAVVWVWAVGPAATVPVTLELLTFVCTHKGGGAAWRTGCFRDAPAWVRAVMADGEA